MSKFDSYECKESKKVSNISCYHWVML